MAGCLVTYRIEIRASLKDANAMALTPRLEGHHHAPNASAHNKDGDPSGTKTMNAVDDLGAWRFVRRSHDAIDGSHVSVG